MYSSRQAGNNTYCLLSSPLMYLISDKCLIATKLRKYFEKTKDKVLTIRNIRRHFGCYGFSDYLPHKSKVYISYSSYLFIYLVHIVNIQSLCIFLLHHLIVQLADRYKFFPMLITIQQISIDLIHINVLLTASKAILM